MKRSILALGLALAMTAPLAARAARETVHMTSQQVAAMHAKMSHVQTLIAEINKSYSTQFAIAPKSEAMAMAHMARANMEMSKAMMEMQVFWTATPPAPAYPTSGGQ